LLAWLLDPEPSAVIEDVIDPVEMIQLLEESYTAKGWNLKHKYLTELFQIKAEHFDSIRAFINQLKALKSKLDQLGVKLPEEAYTVLFIGLFDTQYSVYMAILLCRNMASYNMDIPYTI
jgi:hypothetical protein